jgi:ribosomal protein S18 acetylase RimI-like enzyme
MHAIRPLPQLDPTLVRALISGYTSTKRFTVTSDVSWDHLLFTGVLETCDPPFRKVYPAPSSEDLARYGALAASGHAFGAFDAKRCVGLAICEPIAWNRSLMLWELHVAPDVRRRGVGCALAEAVARHARALGVRRVRLETQNTNAPAIQFYAAQGYTVVGIDMGIYSSPDVEPGEIALYMALDME